MFQYGFPTSLIDDVEEVIKIMPTKTYNNVDILMTGVIFKYYIHGTEIQLPYRIYCLEPSIDLISRLSKQQKMILNCIYSRSCDGFVREENINELLSANYEAWCIPYIVKVCDEYVVEILEKVYKCLVGQNNENIKKFCKENKSTFVKSYARMISYWNVFYRERCYRYENYIGHKLFMDCFGYTRSMERIGCKR